ncbi:MAG: RnfABCDGE type electron transport complex subunit A [Firmicutes bacterium]|nr:RnfABCDGE type electron transport complex subunit A [Eubacterium sp.]MBR3054182.1 RnfABCDGE type electron transport complex subunit A [Bacillota bacterium]
MGIVAIIISMILVNNYVFSQFLGICPFLGVSKKLDSAVGMGGAVIFVMVLATAVTWPIQQLLNKFEIGYLQTVVFILVIAALVQLIEMMLKKYMKSLYNALGVYLPLITTNCAVLGVCIANIDASYSYIQSLANSFGAAVGFTLALILFAGVRSTKLVNQDGVPKAFRGVPLVLLSSAILSLSFMGFSGMFS